MTTAPISSTARSRICQSLRQALQDFLAAQEDNKDFHRLESARKRVIAFTHILETMDGDVV